MLGMSMAERVCGMENNNIEDELENKMENKEKDKKDLEEDIFEAIMDTRSGKTFINELCDVKKPWTVDKGGFCGELCCVKPAKNWVLIDNNDKTRSRNLSAIFKDYFWANSFGSDFLTLVKKDNNEKISSGLGVSSNKLLLDLIAKSFKCFMLRKQEDGTYKDFTVDSTSLPEKK